MLLQKIFPIVFLTGLIATQASAFTIDATAYKKQAHSWVSTYLHNDNNLMVSQENFQLIANLCYFSLQRSLNTLEAQDQAIKSLTLFWNGWQNIAQRRLDPSHTLPNQIADTEKKETPELFWKLHDEHQKIGTTYTHAVNNIVHDSVLTSAQALKSVQEIRESSRAVVAQALLDVKSYLGDLFYLPKNKKITDETVKELTSTGHKGASLLDHIWTYIPQLAMYSFVNADKLNNEVSEEAWEILKKVQDVGIRTWQAIEEGRASFYLAHYKAILEVMAKIGLPEKYRTVLFDEHGIIPENDRTTLLQKL